MIKSLSTEKIIKFGLYLLLIILINLAATTLFFRIDLTANNKYSLSKVSRETVRSLPEPMTINVFFSKDLPSPYITTEKYLRDLLKEYSIYSNQNFNYKFHSVDPSSGKNVQKARSHGINPVQVQVIQEDELKYKNAYMGLSIIHGDAVEKIPAIESKKRLEYKLTSSMQNLKNKVSALLNLKDKVRIRLYLSRELQDIGSELGLEGIGGLPSQLKQVVSDLNSENYQKLDFQHVESGKMQTAKNKYQLQELRWPDIPEKNIQSGSGAIGIVLKHGDKSKTISPVNVKRVPLVGTQYNLMDKKQLRKDINSQLKTLLGINENLGYLTNAGTLNISPRRGSRQQRGQGASAFNQLVQDSYNLSKIDLQQGIPEGLNTLVIAGPQEEFTDYELFQIDQALMRGTNLAVFLDSYKQKSSPSPNQMRRQRRPRYTTLSTGLEKLLAKYGVEIEDSIVMDENCYEQDLSRSTGSNRGGKQPVYFAPLIKNKNINHQPRFMKNLTRLVSLKNAPVQTKNSSIQENSLRAEKLFSSSQKSWTKRSSNLQFNPAFINPPRDPSKQHSRPLAYYVSGEFPSYFQGKSIPEQEKNATTKSGDQSSGKEGEIQSKIKAPDSIIPRSKQAKLFVIGSSQMLSDQVIDPKGNSPNSIFVMNVLDALNNRADMAELRAKTQEFSPLPELSPATRTSVKLFNILGLPILMFIFGLVVWLSRNRRKKAIQRKFSRG